MKLESSLLIKKGWLTTRGFSLVEVLLSVSIFILIVTSIAGVFLFGQESTSLSGFRARAVFIASEGLEAVRNIRDADFTLLTDGTHGLIIEDNKWILSGNEDINDIFTRQVQIEQINAAIKKITVSISWQQNRQRTGLITLITYLTNWQPAL